jgi:hypothetical protein
MLFSIPRCRLPCAGTRANFVPFGTSHFISIDTNRGEVKAPLFLNCIGTFPDVSSRARSRKPGDGLKGIGAAERQLEVSCMGA